MSDWISWARERAKEHAEKADEAMRHRPVMLTETAQAHALTAIALVEVAKSGNWEAPEEEAF